jgi:DNA-directed RNA polymerase subunit RPC12/RpoP
MGDYECGICGAQFGDRYSMDGHIASMHPGQTSERFECGMCGEKFGSNNELVSHMATAHPKYVAPVTVNK